MDAGEKKEERASVAGARNPRQGMKIYGDTGGDALPKRAGIPWLTALAVLELAYPYFREKRGLGFGQLILKYQSGECKITRMEALPGSSDGYRVQVMSSVTTILATDIKHL